MAQSIPLSRSTHITFFLLQAGVEHFSHPSFSMHHFVPDPLTSKVHPRMTFVESLKKHQSEQKQKN